METRCEFCKYARKAENSEYVGCVAALGAKETLSDDFVFDFYGRNQICTGWVHLQVKPNCEDTTTFGMITNGIPCFKKEDRCKHYMGDF